MKNKLISVIIPIYNTADYLDRVINSILQQTYKNFELILINDGSTDNSEEICFKYAKNNKFIKYISKKNGGQGSARNLGLQKAKGDYVVFVDSDDYILENTLEILLKRALDNNADLVYCDMYKGCNKNHKIEASIFNRKYDEKTNYLLMNAGPCNILIEKKLIKKIKFQFPENIYYEDLAVIPILGMHAKKVKYVEKPLYFYEVRPNSVMNQLNYNRKLEDIFVSINKLRQKYRSDCLKYDEILEFIIIRRFMSASLRFIEFDDPYNCINKIEEYINKNFPLWKKNKFFKELKLKQKIVAFLAFKNRKKLLKLIYVLNK